MSKPYEELVVLNVTDQKTYQQYRKAMTPILEEHTGYFRLDLSCSTNHKTETGFVVTRVFIIGFSSKEKRDAFFKNPQYLKARQLFDASTAGVQVIGQVADAPARA